MAYTLEQLTKAWTAVHDGIVPDATTTADLQTYINLAASGQITDAQALGFVINSGDSTTALAALSYQFFTGKAPTKAGLDYLVNSPSNPSDLNDPYYAKFNIENRYINFAANLGVQGEGAAGFAAKYGAMSFSDYIASIYETIIGGSFAKAAGVDAAKAIADIASRQSAILATAQASGMITPGMTAAQIDLVVKAAAAGYLLGEAIKADVGIYAGAANGFMLALATGNPVYGADITKTYAPTPGPAGQPVAGTPPVLPGTPSAPASPLHLTLTAGTDNLAGNSGDDTFTGTHATFNAADTLNGDDGFDSLTIAATGSTYFVPAATVTGIETATINNNGAIMVDTTGWTGLTQLNVTATSAFVTTAATTTNETLTVAAQDSNGIRNTGGHDVTINATGATSGQITLDDATGAIVVNRATADTNYVGAITISGGATIDVTQTATVAVGNNQYNGDLTINGGALTRSVKIAMPKLTDNGVHGATSAGDITIADVNAGSTTARGAITSVDVSGVDELRFFGTALTSLKAAHVENNITINNSGLTTGAATTLNLTANDATGGGIQDQGVYTTMNLTLGAEASRFSFIDFAALTTLNISGVSTLALATAAGLNSLQTITITGSAALDGTSGLTADFGLFANLTSINASGTSGANNLTIDAATASFTGGSGADSLALHSGSINKSIAMGGGNDTLYFANNTVLGAGVTVSGGAGTADVLALSAADAATFSGSGVFAAKVTGFEQLILTAPSNQTVDLATLGGYHYVTTSGGNGLTLNGLSSGDTLVLNGSGTGYALGAANFGGTNDTLNLKLIGNGQTDFAYSGGIDGAGIETLVITLDDQSVSPNGAYQEIKWLNDDLKTITVTGNAEPFLKIDGQGLTSVDAHTVTLGGLTLYVGSLNNHLTVLAPNQGFNLIDAVNIQNGVTYTGGAGQDQMFLAGGGVNTIDFGVDSVEDLVKLTNGNTTSAFATITHVGASDKLRFGGMAAHPTTIGAEVVIGTGSPTLNDYINAAAAGDGHTTGIVRWFHFGGDTYIVYDVSASSSFSAGDDYLVKLTGNINVGAASVNAGDIVFA